MRYQSSDRMLHDSARPEPGAFELWELRLWIRRDPAVQMHVPERVVPPRLEHRAPQRPLVTEPAPLGDTARSLMAEGMAELQPVYPQVGQRPARGHGQGADGEPLP